MRRPNPAVRPEDALAAWDAAQSSAASTPVTVRCRLMTPMYGGGVEPGSVDSAMPIRPSAIRGQLRFWWRLLNDTDRSPRDVFAAESALWGGISSTGPRASLVTLQVGGRPVGPGEMDGWESQFGAPRYALILDPGADPRLLNAGYEFTLTLRFSKAADDAQRKQVIEALRWWASFGGVGARTRRGLGAVRVTSNDIELKPVTCKEVEAPGGRMALRAPAEPIDAWNNAVETLKHFRQGENLGRNRGAGKRAGRSRWPEPDTIRRRTHTHAPGHEPEHAASGFFPRAAFGLPIVFQFKDRNRGDPRGRGGKGLMLAPSDTVDERGRPVRRDRMASPLILRPYYDGTRYRPLALLLPRWKQRVSISVDLDSDHVGPAWPKNSGEWEKQAALIAPLRGLGADALTAFMHYFEHYAREHHGRGGRSRGGR